MGHPTTTENDSRNREHAVSLARIRAISRQRATALAGSLMLMLFVIGTLWSQFPAVALLAWLCANLLFIGWRHWRWKRAPYNPAMTAGEASAWLRESAFASGVNACIWAGGAAAFLNDASFSGYLFFVLVLTSLVFGASVSFAAWFPSVVAFAVPVTLAAALKMATLDHAGSTLVAISCLPFLLFVLVVAHNYSRLITTLVTLDARNAALLVEAEQGRAEVERSSAEKSHFFAAVSHDVRQPLYATGLLLEALAKRVTTNEQRKLIADIQRSHGAMDLLFTSILDLTQLDAGAVTAKVDHVDLGSVLETLRGEFAPSAARKCIGFDVSATEVRVHTDPVLLSRILRNLLGNAIKFTDAGGVDVTVIAHESNVQIRVSDTGPGIPVAEQGKVFAEYYQLGNPERDRGKGLGLGLAVVRRLCVLLDIELELASAPGRGTVFTLSMPAGHPKANKPSYSAASAPDIAGLHVVVVDDERTILRGLKMLLGDYGCQVTIGESSSDAISAARKVTRPPDIIISDLRLRGDGDGVDVIHTIRAEFDARLPALLVTGDTDRTAVERAASAGLRLMYKPLAPHQLVKTIASLVEL